MTNANAPSRLLAYLQLCRLPNVFTAAADVAMGFFIAHSRRDAMSVRDLVVLVAASCLLYTAGMVLNDVFDYDADLAERPQRPLPSGRIALGVARRLGFVLLLSGAGLAWLVGTRSGVVASALAGAVLAYDAAAKKMWAGPWVMGSCRSLNILLGMSGGAAVASWGGFAAAQWLIALGVGVYVMGITWFARSEARESDRRLLGLGLTVMGVGVCLLALYPWVSDAPLMLRSPLLWPTLLVLLMVSVVRRCMLAIAEPTPSHVQQAVKHAILSLIVLDAAVVLAVRGPVLAIGVLALLIPTLTLGKWVYST